ncbi:MAG: CAP domain-containing protein [Candidatus Paceibacterota bacterium]
MKTPLSDYFLPHKDNDDKPHIVRSASLLLLSFVVIVVFAGSVFETSRIRGDGHFIAAVLPSVLVSLTNADRTEYGLIQLEHSTTLEQAAQLKANDMVSKGYFDHVSPEGVTPWVWFEQVGYSFVHAGENLAINFSESADVVEAWMNSEGHRMNILDSNFTQTGIATAVGMYKGKEAVFVVQLFGTPRPRTTTQTAPTNTENTQSEVAPFSVTEGEELESPSFGVVAGSEASTQEKLEESENLTDVALAEPVETIALEETLVVPNETNPQTIDEKEPVPTVTPDEKEAIARTSAERPTSFDRWFSLHPTVILQSVYLVIAFFVIFALGLMVRREAHLRHPRTVTAGVSLIVLMVLLTYLTREYTLPMQFFASV